MVFKKYLSVAFTNSEQNKFYLANSKPINWNPIWTVQTACRWRIAIKTLPLLTIGGHGTLQKYRGTGTRYFSKISTAVPVPVLSNSKYRGTFAVLF